MQRVTVCNPSIYILFGYTGIYISVYNLFWSQADRQTDRQTDGRTDRHRTRDARTAAGAEVEGAGRVGAEDGRAAAAEAVRADKCSTSRGGPHSLRVLGVQSVP